MGQVLFSMNVIECSKMTVLPPTSSPVLRPTALCLLTARRAGIFHPGLGLVRVNQNLNQNLAKAPYHLCLYFLQTNSVYDKLLWTKG